MKKIVSFGILTIGFLIFLGGLFLYGLGIHQLLPIPRPDLFIWATSIAGIALIICGVCELFFKKTREQEIEAKDERNIALGNAAKATGFEVFTSLFSIAILILALLGYMNTVSFFTLFAAFFIGQSAFIGRLWYLHKNM
ncbi:MAG TPA: hypothetical protein H9669_00390 [Firmicutes bacterium]|nr:hypothetical protein [Bacillota bacterium]